MVVRFIMSEVFESYFHFCISHLPFTSPVFSSLYQAVTSQAESNEHLNWVFIVFITE